VNQTGSWRNYRQLAERREGFHVGVRLEGVSEDRTAVLRSRISGCAFSNRDDAVLGQSPQAFDPT
jgi:hypothetical protein